GPKWWTDGKMSAFKSATNSRDLAKQERKKRKEEELKKAVAAETSPSPGQEGEKEKAPDSSAKKTESESEHESDIHVITRAVYRSDEDGYLDPKHPQHIWVITAPRNAEEKVQPKQLTTGRFEEGNVVWEKDSAQ